MSYSMALRASAGVLPSTDKGKEEEVSASGKDAGQGQTPIDALSGDVLDLIFRYATMNYRDKKALCTLREVGKSWYTIVDIYHLRSSWNGLQSHIQHPVLRSFVDQIVFVDHFVSKAITSAISSHRPELDPAEQTSLSTRIDYMGPSAFDRFVLLTQCLREQGAPIPSTHAVLGFETLPYEKMQQRFDMDSKEVLETIWSSRIRQQINFKGAPIPTHAEAIREWLNNPINSEKIASMTGLDLSKLYLGVLPPEISKLSQLTCLDLSRNDRLTTLSPQVGKLSQLRILNLNQNQFRTFPPEIGKLSQLRVLNLHGNQLTALSPEIGNLSHLTELDLYANQLTTLPPEIGNLSRLTRLITLRNRITTLPPEIGNLSQLTEFFPGSNELTTLPPEIGKLSRLTKLCLNQNQLITLPSEIGNLTQLTTLDLSYNWLATIPHEIGNLSQLTELRLFYNRLTTLPSEIGNLSHFTEFNLDENPLIFILDEDFRRFERRGNLNLQQVTDKFSACSSYSCQTPLASLCQQIHLGKEDDLLRGTFEMLPNGMQQHIRQAWPGVPSLLKSSSEAEADLFTDRPSFAQAVITALQSKWLYLSGEQRHQAYLQVAVLAGQPKAKSSWGKAHAQENIIRLIDAMELTTRN